MLHVFISNLVSSRTHGANINLAIRAGGRVVKTEVKYGFSSAYQAFCEIRLLSFE